INEKIRAALRRPPPGPPLKLAEFDVEAVLAQRRTARPSGSG
ncbi:DUF1992 domain-containing protein, partial [Streptomyces sp. NPDC059525]